METNEQLDAMLADYAKSIQPKFTPKPQSNVYDPKNYFTIYDLEDGEQTKTKEIRILPNPNGGSPIIPFKAHVAYVDGKKTTFACLKHLKGEPCPFCEVREQLLADGGEDDKKLAKEFGVKEMYIVKLIDRADEEHGPKFWRFNAAYDKKGAYDMIMGTVNALKKNKAIMDPEVGRDLSIVITRNEKKVPVVTSVVAQESEPISENEAQKEAWLSDTRTWESVYSVKGYDYLEIVVSGGIPVWNKDLKQFVDKNSLNKTGASDAQNEPDEITMGIETVKTNILAAATEIEDFSTEEDEGDDLPF